MLGKSKDRVIYAYTTTTREGLLTGALSIVSLHPPNRWRLDHYSELEEEIGDYKLTRLGRIKTRLDITWKEKWKTKRFLSRTKYLKYANYEWDCFIAELEKDYKCRTP